MSDEAKKLAVEYSFTGFWVILFFVGIVVIWRTANHPNRAYRAFVPVLGLGTVLLLVGTIVAGGAYYPH